ncbi:MAG: O-antigen ligase family protein [Paludibacteraceae bacterium]|nr:O-antigen ligase family protein [Paludibacteraceae bacterium]
MIALQRTISYLQLLAGSVLFLCTPFFYNNITRWSLFLFAGLSVIDCIVNKRYQNNPIFSLQKLPFWACIVYYLLQFIYYPMEQDLQHWSFLAENRLSFLIFGILGLLGAPVIKAKHLSFLSIAGSLGIIGYLLYNTDLTTTYWIESMNAFRAQHVQAHMLVNMFMNIAIACCFWRIKKQTNWYKTALYVALIALFFGFIYLSGGRSGAIGSGVVVIIGLLYLFKQYTYLKYICSFIIAVCLVGVMYIANKKENDLSRFENNLRFTIWHETLHVIKEQPIIGYGASTAASKIATTFAQSEQIKKDTFLIEHAQSDTIVGAHPHNQLLHGILEYGIAGLLCALVLLFGPITYTLLNKSNIMLTALCLAIVIQLQTDVIRGAFGDFSFQYYLLFIMAYAQQSAKKVICG